MVPPAVTATWFNAVPMLVVMASADSDAKPLKVWVSNAAWFWAARNDEALARPIDLAEGAPDHIELQAADQEFVIEGARELVEVG
jgi:hypothetical protein